MRNTFGGVKKKAYKTENNKTTVSFSCYFLLQHLVDVSHINTKLEVHT